MSVPPKPRCRLDVTDGTTGLVLTGGLTLRPCWERFRSQKPLQRHCSVQVCVQPLTAAAARERHRQWNPPPNMVTLGVTGISPGDMVYIQQAGNLGGMDEENQEIVLDSASTTQVFVRQVNCSYSVSGVVTQVELTTEPE